MTFPETPIFDDVMRLFTARHSVAVEDIQAPDFPAPDPYATDEDTDKDEPQ